MTTDGCKQKKTRRNLDTEMRDECGHDNGGKPHAQRKNFDRCTQNAIHQRGANEATGGQPSSLTNTIWDKNTASCTNGFVGHLLSCCLPLRLHSAIGDGYFPAGATTLYDRGCKRSRTADHTLSAARHCYVVLVPHPQPRYLVLGLHTPLDAFLFYFSSLLSAPPVYPFSYPAGIKPWKS